MIGILGQVFVDSAAQVLGAVGSMGLAQIVAPDTSDILDAIFNPYYVAFLLVIAALVTLGVVHWVWKVGRRFTFGRKSM